MNHKVLKLYLKKARVGLYRLQSINPHTLIFGCFAAFLILFSGIDDTKGNSTYVASAPSVVPPAEAEVSDPLKDDPWKFFYPAWRKNRLWSLLESIYVSPTDPVLKLKDLDRYVLDPDGRVEKEFRVPERLKKRVVFWMQVFARFSSQIRLVHDRSEPEIIYGYIDMRPLFRSMSSTAAAEARAVQIEKKVITALKLRMREAAGLSKTTLLDAEDKTGLHAILSQLGGLNPAGITRVSESVRTQTGQRDMFLAAIQRSRVLLPHIESVLKQSGLPGGLGRIPFVESAFNVRATSKIGAVGIWQFVPETARQMIHQSNEERWAEPLIQTKAAARLLRMYRNILPDWGMAITAYNSGVGRMQRLSKKYRITRAEQLLDVPASEDLGFAGKNFYSEFLAVTLLEAYKEDIFEHLVAPTNYELVFKGKEILPKQICDF